MYIYQYTYFGLKIAGHFIMVLDGKYSAVFFIIIIYFIFCGTVWTIFVRHVRFLAAGHSIYFCSSMLII